MEYLEKISGWIKGVCSIALGLLCLAVVLQLLVGGTAVPFMPGDVVGNIIAMTKQLGSEGLVGLAALFVLVHLFERKGMVEG
jgi:hypothetical protein